MLLTTSLYVSRFLWVEVWTSCSPAVDSDSKIIAHCKATVEKNWLPGKELGEMHAPILCRCVWPVNEQMAPTVAFDVRHLTAYRCIASECSPRQPVPSLLSVLIEFLPTAHLVVVTSARCAPARITEIGENGVAYTDKTACLRLSCLSG